jgi:hypothetical protein
MKNKKKIKTTKKNKSQFIGKGSFGCVFKPSIPCKKDLPKSKRTHKKNKVSKILIKKGEKNHSIKEFNMNKIIRSIPNYKEWSYTWKEMCDPPSYENIKKLAEIDTCLNKIDKDKDDYNRSSHMLIGEYGGVPLSKYCLKLFKKSSFSNKKSFLKLFLKLFKLTEPLFIGSIELSKRKISHMDLSRGNIMVKENRCYMIDFGLSCRYSNKKDIKSRSLGQLNGSRIYNPYPLDFIYAYASEEDKEEELDSFEDGVYRNNYDEYSYIHKNVFHRKNLEEDIFNNLTGKSNNRKLIENLDTYSIGYLIPHLILEISEKYRISKKVLSRCMDYTEIQNHLALLKDMTEYDAVNRIPIKEAYERYKSL